MHTTDTTTQRDTFTELRSLLQAFAAEMKIVADQDDTYYLEAKGVHDEDAPRLFAAIQLYGGFVRLYVDATDVETIFQLYGFKKINRLYTGGGVLRFSGVQPDLVDDLVSFLKLLKKKKDQREAEAIS